MSLVTSTTYQQPRNSVSDVPPETYFSTLPTELAAEILTFVEWIDLLNVRRTCKFLAEVTRSRNIWNHLIDEHMSTHSLPPCFERPISMYSSQELENILLRWKSADRAFESNTLEPARERKFTGVDTERMHLVKGGRWLLMTSPTASVTYFDLDSETIAGVELIPDQRSEATLTSISMSIEHDMQSSFLGLNIALYFPSQDRSGKIHFQVWRVAAVLDDKCYVIGLKATQVASFGRDLEIIQITSLSLLGSSLAFIGYSRFNHPLLYIVNWQESHENYTQSRMLAIPPAFIEMGATCSLLPRKKLLVTMHREYRLYDYTSPSTGSSSRELHQPSFQSVWATLDDERMGYYISACFFDDTKASIVWRCASLICAITFPHSSLTTFKAEDAVDATTDHFCIFISHYLGSRRSFLIDRDEVKVLCYPRLNMGPECADGTERLNTWSRTCGVTYGGSMTDAAADEDTGRIVYLTSRDRGNDFAVVDFAQVYPPTV